MPIDSIATDDSTASADPVRPEPCPNCGAGLRGAFCSACGQRDQPLRQSAVQFVREALVEVIGIDGRLWKTLYKLFLRPGGLTTAYIEGRRTQYIRPLRLYLTASVLFFFLISVIDPVGRVQRQINQGISGDTTSTVAERLDLISVRLEDDAARLVDDQSDVSVARNVLDSLNQAVPIDSAAVVRAQRTLSRAESKAQRTSSSITLRKTRFDWQRSVLEKYPPDSTIRPFDLATASDHVFPGDDANSNTGEVNIGLPEWAIRNDELRRARDATNNTDRMNAIVSFGKGTIRRIPAVLFILLPVFALLLKMLYAKSRLRTLAKPATKAAALATGRSVSEGTETAWYYTEHLVFGLHSHAFLFFVFAIVTILGELGGWVSWVQFTIFGLLMWTQFYFVLAMKRVYGQGWMKTIVKATLLGGVYQFLLLSVGFLLAVLLAALLG